MVIETHDPEETFRGRKDDRNECEAGTDLHTDRRSGSWKTVFTQGVAAGLGITEPVNSPTFTIIQEYEDGRLPFYHFDVYRIGDLEEMEEIGYDDYFFGQGICLIEWAELIEEILPEKGSKLPLKKILRRALNTERSPLRREEKRQNESFGTGQFRNRGIRSRCGGRYTGSGIYS